MVQTAQKYHPVMSSILTEGIEEADLRYKHEVKEDEWDFGNEIIFSSVFERKASRKNEWMQLITSNKNIESARSFFYVEKKPNIERERHGFNDVLLRLHTEILELKQRLDTLERSKDRIFDPSDKDEKASDPYIEWCMQNIAKIRSVPNCYLAIDIEKGEIVIAEIDQTEFARKLEALPKEIRSKLYRAHSSTFV